MYLDRLLFLSVLSLCFFMAVPAVSGVVYPAKISIDVTDLKMPEVFKLISRYSDKDIICGENVGGKLTISLDSLSWREVLDTVLQMQGLIKHETDNVIMIMTAEESNKNSTLKKQEVFKLRYASALELTKLLRPSGALSEHGKVEADDVSNSVVVTDVADNIQAVKRLLQKIDVPAKQILIEARVVNADDTFLRELGLEFNGQMNPSGNSLLDKSIGSSSDKSQLNLAVAKFSNGGMLDVHLTALENDGRGKVISRPKLLATDRRAAYIEAGEEIPYQEKGKSGNTSVAFKKAVLSLTVTPEVIGKNSIQLNLQLNQDKVGHLMINGVPTIDTRKIHTQVLVKNNETIVLGGIYEWSKSNKVTKVPFLGDIPLLGLLFSKKEIRTQRRELLIFVTPMILST